MSKHFLIVLAPQRDGGWRAHFPDLPGCRAEGPRVEMVVERARRAASERVASLSEQAADLPAPRTLEEIKADEEWAKERSIDWMTAVISVVAITGVR